jgi:hypothetical protein
MERTRTEGFPPPPGIINSLKAGFDAIAAHIYAIFLPILLNLFFWLGPRLRMDALFNSIKPNMISMWRASNMPVADIQKMIEGYEAYEKILPGINLFRFVRTFPIGISSMVFPDIDGATPLGSPLILQVGTLSLIGWIALLTLIGWVGGALYFRSVSRIAMDGSEDSNIGFLRAMAQTGLLSITFTVLTLVIGFPLILLLALVLQLNEFLMNILVLALSLASMWLIVPLFFWPHGLFVRKQNFITSMITSIQMARFTLPTSSMFILVVFLLAVGLNYLWTIPPQNSWMTLFGIFGHAFVTTALLAASFIYYRDMNIWLQMVIDRVRAATPRQML